MPRPHNTEQRKSQIVRGLARAMARCGYAKATVQEIASEAGLTPGLIHYHFGSKQEILINLIQSLAQVVRTRLDSGASDPSQRLDAAIEALVGTAAGVETEAVACWVVIGSEAVRQPEVRELYESLMREARAELEGIFRDAMHKEGRSDEQAPAAAVAVLAAIEGFFRLAAGAPSCVPPGTAADIVRAIAAGFIRSSPEAA